MSDVVKTLQDFVARGMAAQRDINKLTGKTLVITNASAGDETFDSDRGSWNVTRARRDCRAGKHKHFAINVAEAVEASSNVEVEEAKIDALVAHPETIQQLPPLIYVAEGTQNGSRVIWLIDGHHRVRALHRLGVCNCAGYIIDESEIEQYRIRYNGERIAPWFKHAATTPDAK